MYTRAGYHFVAVEEQCSPDPDFINTTTANPEEAGSYELAIEYAKREGCRSLSFLSVIRMLTVWGALVSSMTGNTSCLPVIRVVLF